MSIRVQSAVKTGCGVPARCLEHSRAAIRRDAPRPGHPLHRLPAPERLGAVLTHWITPKQGEIRGPADSHVADEVSIRSPYRSKGRCGLFKLLRGQPQVSIRSPYRSKGRCWPSIFSSSNPPFQSAPLTEARGDPATRSAYQAPMSFNPLPLPKQGEILNLQTTDPKLLVSIRSPYRSKGRCGYWSSDGQPCQVSIRSPYRSKGRFMFVPLLIRSINCFNPLPLPKQGEIPACVTRFTASVMFQSAPLTEARGDKQSAEAIKKAIEFQSAPLTEARGDAFRSRKGADSTLFQSAPLTEARGDFVTTPQTATLGCFNPLPLPKQGEMGIVASIRCSLGSFNPLPLPKQGEIVTGTGYGALLDLFQSAPLTEARGDFNFGYFFVSHYMFQSAPLTEARGDSMATAQRPG